MNIVATVGQQHDKGRCKSQKRQTELVTSLFVLPRRHLGETSAGSGTTAPGPT
jgi:hypothetical protein